jgi:hypothetical protein
MTNDIKVRLENLSTLNKSMLYTFINDKLVLPLHKMLKYEASSNCVLY